MFKYKKYILLTMLCWGMQNMCMATHENSANSTDPSVQLNGNMVNELRMFTGQLSSPSIHQLPVPVGVDVRRPFNAALANDPFFGQLSFDHIPAPQPENPRDIAERELNKPAAPKKDIFAESDPVLHIEQMLEAVHRYQCKIEYRLFKRKDLQNLHKKPNALLKAVRNYLHNNFMPRNRSFIVINGQRVLKHQNFIDRIRKCMKTVLDHGNEKEVQASLYILSSIIKNIDNPPTINTKIMNVSDYINRLEDITQNIVILSQVYKKYLKPNIGPLGAIITSFLI
jgi:hypothetical protein